jgi:hypothetical protein
MVGTINKAFLITRDPRSLQYWSCSENYKHIISVSVLGATRVHDVYFVGPLYELYAPISGGGYRALALSLKPVLVYSRAQRLQWESSRTELLYDINDRTT